MAMRVIQKGIADFTYIIGMGLKYGGAGALFLMAIVGTISIDLVLLAAAEKTNNSFLTGFILGSMFSRGNIDPLPLLIISPITSLIAVTLSFVLAVPTVGVAILAGWALAASLLALGSGIEAIAQAIEPDESEAEYSSLRFA
ncbi:MAG: hypothetical protein PSV35_05640 [bacterium]|nr:hypothetical protein [bacterium]